MKYSKTFECTTRHFYLLLEANEGADVSKQTGHVSFGSNAGGTAAAEAMASQLHNNYRLQQMASEGYDLSAKSIGGRRTPPTNKGPSFPSPQNLSGFSNMNTNQSSMKH